MAFLQYTPPGTSEALSHPMSRQDINIGRSDGNSIVLKDEAASRTHAVIRATPEGYLLADNGSANGTYVNGKRVTEHMLQEGDSIRIGKTILSFSERPDPNATIAIDPEAYAKQVAEQEAQLRAGQPAVADAVAAGPPPPAPPPVVASPPPAPVAPPPTPAAPPPAPAAPPPVSAPKAAAPPPVPAASPPPAPQSPPKPAAAPPPVRPAVSSARPAGPVVATGDTAGFGIRLLAYLVDGVLIGVVVGVILAPSLLISAAMADSSPGLAALISLLSSLLAMVASLAYVLYFWATRGATLAKQWFGLKIVREDGEEPLGWAKAALRLAGYIASGFILYIGFIMIAFTEGNRGLHDMIAGTKVIRTK